MTLTLRSETAINHTRALASKVSGILDVLPLETDGDVATAGELLRGIETVYREADDARKSEKAPHLEAGRAVDSAFKAPMGELERVKGLLRARLSQAATARENARLTALAAVQSAVVAGDAVAANAAMVVASKQGPAVEGISERFTWEPVSFVLAEMPREYLAVDMPKVRAEAAAAVREGRAPAISGVMFERRAVLTVRGIK